ncbi:TPA: hypothetical protein RPW11_001900 [Campylobacter fetus subsp. venerealis]|nr:hypothetical protein [Campylobacter fetus subsp. venerealis]HDX6260430.1 hypothetical protein [Campylobacter fetus subsp. venerealis]HDX6268339.1 hypothetical protein [Campylobacter fetus subsp. venerealis]HDX6276288.1 hypothetical protein [Campylobacter fetus subsp. venerealis]HDX6327242.1 hypothetical protein [Campylobacter fetus subsp. venerealis]
MLSNNDNIAVQMEFIFSSWLENFSSWLENFSSWLEKNSSILEKFHQILKNIAIHKLNI